MNSLLQKVIFNLTQATKNFEIIKKKYLVPVKPKKSLSGYMIFSNQNRSRFTGKVTEVATKTGAQWKNLTDQQRQVYNDKAKFNSEKHTLQLNAYNEKYIQPFKKLTLNNMIMKNVYVKHPDIKSIVEGGRLYAQQLKTITAEEKAQLEAQLLVIKAQRAKIQEIHQIPEPEVPSLRAYMMKNAGERSITDFTLIERQKLTIQYEAYLQTYKKKLQQFANRFNITLADLEDIIKLHEKREKRKEKQNEQAEQQILVKETVKVVMPKVKKTPVKKVPKVAKVPAKKQTGKRVTKTASLTQSVLSSITAEQRTLQKDEKAEKRAALKATKAQTTGTPAATTTTTTTATQ